MFVVVVANAHEFCCFNNFVFKSNDKIFLRLKYNFKSNSKYSTNFVSYAQIPNV